MAKQISRGDFLKLAGAGIAAWAVPDYLRHLWHGRIREASMAGGNGSIATTCGECPAGCGLLVHAAEGHTITLEGNPAHPVNRGFLCPHAQAALPGLNAVGRFKGAVRQAKRGSGDFIFLDWPTAIDAVKKVWQKYKPAEIAFVLGLFPDHLNDLVQMLSATLGGANVLRFGLAGEYEGRVTLVDAAQKLFGTARIPRFDLQRAELIYFFGNTDSESWLPPVFQASKVMEAGQLLRDRRAYQVQFAPRCPPLTTQPHEWIPIRPGSEAIVAQALGRLIAEAGLGADCPGSTESVLAYASEFSGVPEREIRRLAGLFRHSRHPLAIPGSLALGQANGLAAAEAILALNILAGNLGKEGGLYLAPEPPLHPYQTHRPCTSAEILALIERMRSRDLKALFIHGVDLLDELPASFGFADSLQQVEQVVSFASVLNATAMQADYIFPDRVPLESWGYQKALTGSDRLTISALQPVVEPRYDTRSTVDVLLAAAQAAGGGLADALPYCDEMDFLQKSSAALMNQDGVYESTDPASFWSYWRQQGGWWKGSAGWLPPVSLLPGDRLLRLEPAQFSGEMKQNELYLLLFPGQYAGRVEIHPHTARRLGLGGGDRLRIVSPNGALEGVVHPTPTVYLNTLAIPMSRGDHSENPLDLLGKETNRSGSLIFGSQVSVQLL